MTGRAVENILKRMTLHAVNEISVGKYTGVFGEKYKDAGFLKQLEDLPKLLEGDNAEVISSGRNRNTRINLLCNGKQIDIVVKVFRSQSTARSWLDVGKGSKAYRTWIAASCLQGKNVGTPSPIGFLDRWQDGSLVESYYLSEFQDEITSFKDELVRLFRNDPQCEKFMALLQCVADAVRAMHDAGFLHNDLGNQNILLRRTGEGWGDIQFIDLNRGRIRESLTMRERARDISRLYLPSDLLRVFKEMCFAPSVPPKDFQKWEKIYRRLYAVHSGTRWLRHPLREMAIKKKERGKEAYPSEKNMWIWDERSGQPVNALKSRDRLRYYELERNFQIILSVLSGFLPVLFGYFSLLKSCYKKPVLIKDRIGVAINPRPETVDREKGMLEELGTIPVLVRFYSHETEKEWSFLSHIVKTLHGEGHLVSIALVQNRKAVLDPEKWALFVTSVLERVSGCVDFVEIGHAINRVKWGVWDLEEHLRLIDAVAAIADRYPGIKFMGPAVIDFEYPFVMAALSNVPENLHLSALSHHLYVDRRGAPENRQGLFSALEKFVLARAIARCSPKCEDSLVISEVNWPLKGTGVYSPVGSPYESPGARFNDPSVSEDDYADFMLRYLLIALCSGMVDRVYWWRLVARGYGLVDDTDPQAWRKRPAYVVLQYFLSALGESEFQGRQDSGGNNVCQFMFKNPGGRKVCIAYSSGGDVDFKLPSGCGDVVDATGKKIADGSASTVRLSGRPVYLYLN